MAHVITDTGVDLGDVTDQGALNYYRREAGYTIDDVKVGGEVEVEVGPPAKSANKDVWLDYALSVDPDNADAINEMTVAELQDTYGE